MFERVELQPGLALIRYVADDFEDYNARIEIDLPHDVDAAFDPSCRGPVLERPGQCVAISCGRPTVIELRLESSGFDENVRGSVTVEYLAKSRRSAQAPGREPRRKMSQRSTSRSGESSGRGRDDSGRARDEARGVVSIAPVLTGHVAYRGDVVARDGEWLAGPSEPRRIEGLTLDWPECPSGTELLVCDPASGQTAGLGQFIGSKGKSRPLRGLEIWLEGRGAEQFELVAEATFLGAGHVRKQGKWIAFMGQNASDELTGLKLEILPATRAVPESHEKNTPFDRAVEHRSHSSKPTGQQRTRIFRK